MGTSKIPIFKHFSEFGKIWQSRLDFTKISINHVFELGKLGSIHSPRPTFQNPNCECIDELGKNMY